MTPQKYQELVDKIVEAVPGIIGLDFGCRIDTGGFSKMIVLNENQCVALHPAMPRYELQGLPQRYKILGRPITLEDIFIVMTRKNSRYPSVTDSQALLLIWHLGKPLSQQSDEVKEWLWKVICKK